MSNQIWYFFEEKKFVNICMLVQTYVKPNVVLVQKIKVAQNVLKNALIFEFFEKFSKKVFGSKHMSNQIWCLLRGKYFKG